MALEDDAFRDNPPPTPRGPPKPRTTDWIFRGAATLLLLGFLTAILWFMFLYVPLMLVIVVAALIMIGASLASRIYHLRLRVQTLEAALDHPDVSAPRTTATPRAGAAQAETAVSGPVPPQK